MTTASAEQHSYPLVVGFDRFARHQEISSAAAGRLLLTELNCTTCHPSADKSLAPKGGPRLNGAGDRLRREWIIEFLVAPQKAKAGTTMPDLLAALPAAERQPAANRLAAFLMSQRQAFPDIKGSGLRAVPHEFWNHGSADEGRVLYHRVGCVACHEPDSTYETVETKPSPLDQLLEQLDEDELKELGLGSAARRVTSVPHAELRKKFTRKSLTYFLLDPHATRPSGRMPNLKLGVVEAADIAAWLMRDKRPGETPDERSGEATSEDETTSAKETTAQLVEEGRRLFMKLGCVNCHAAGRATLSWTARPLAEIDVTAATATCLHRPMAGSSRPGQPHFQLDRAQRTALQASIDRLSRALGAPAPSPLDLRLLQLNCFACHQRDNQGGIGRYRRPYFETVGHVDIGDEGRLPPPLTAVGRKLHAAWMQRVLQGKGDVRAHLRIRMPIFPEGQVKSLPTALVKADRGERKPRSEQEVFGDFGRLAGAGRSLLDTGCVQCHPLRGDALPGVVGVDLEGITGRVQPEWFHDFLLNPAELKPRTRMPTFFPQGLSQNRQILDGDTQQQIAAMWAYLKKANQLPLPDKIERARSQSYELIPRDRPIVLRTFLNDAGTHAIAVGFPAKTHIAFDAESIRLAYAWRGRFLDAQGTWFVRFAPVAVPLGDRFLRLPPGVPFALGERADEADGLTFDPQRANYRFRGYRLDKAGVPTFLYRVGRFDIEERIEPHDNGTLRRRLTLIDCRPEEPATLLWFRGHFGKSLKKEGDHTWTSDAGVTVKATQGIADPGEVRATTNGQEWIVPLKVKRRQAIEVRYTWQP